MSLGAPRDMEEEPSMWIADQWQDYELLDCGGGEKLERWDKQYLELKLYCPEVEVINEDEDEDAPEWQDDEDYEDAEEDALDGVSDEGDED